MLQQQPSRFRKGNLIPLPIEQTGLVSRLQFLNVLGNWPAD